MAAIICLLWERPLLTLSILISEESHEGLNFKSINQSKKKKKKPQRLFSLIFPLGSGGW